MEFEVAMDAAGRVIAPESKTLEYKQDLSSPDKAMESVVAFANSAGGRLVIGIADDGSVVGVENPLLEEERLTNLISDTIRPQLLPTIELIPVGDMTVLVAKVYLGAQRPYYLAKRGRQGGTYIRIGSSDRLAGPGMVAELARDSQGIVFDRLPAAGAKLVALDRAMLADMLDHDMTDQVLQTLSLVTEDQGMLVPTNAGILVGTQHPEMYHPHAWVQCARFRGDTSRNITDQARIYGPLPKAVEAAMDFLKRNAFLHAKFGEIQRTDTYSIPIAPLRELIVNALVHSSYSDHGTPIKIAFYDDSIVIESPGGLVSGLTVEKVLSGTSVIRNPTLARVFVELGYIEQWGTGIPKAMEAILAAGLPALEIEEGHERLIITVHIESHDPVHYGANHKDHKESHKDHKESHKELSDLGPRGMRILEALADNPLSRAELFTILGLHNDYRTFARHIEPLIQAGLIAMTDPERPKVRNQRYALTKAGHETISDKS